MNLLVEVADVVYMNIRLILVLFLIHVTLVFLQSLYVAQVDIMNSLSRKVR